MNKSIYNRDVYKFFRTCFYIAQLLFLFSIQQVPGFLPGIHGGRPILILPLLLTVSLREGNYFALIWGLASGLLLDVYPSKFIGVQAFVMGIMGYLLGKFKDKGHEIRLKGFIALSIFVEPLMILMRFYLNYRQIEIQYIDIMVNYHVLPCVLYTVLVSPFVYLFNRSAVFFMTQKGGGKN